MESATYLTTYEVALYLKVSVSCLEKWRQAGTGPKYSRMGRLIRYRREDVEAYFNAMTVKVAQ